MIDGSDDWDLNYDPKIPEQNENQHAQLDYTTENQTEEKTNEEQITDLFTALEKKRDHILELRLQINQILLQKQDKINVSLQNQQVFKFNQDHYFQYQQTIDELKLMKKLQAKYQITNTNSGTDTYDSRHSNNKSDEDVQCQDSQDQRRYFYKYSKLVQLERLDQRQYLIELFHYVQSLNKFYKLFSEHLTQKK
ncbi:UNKNOWN [Stylonychia lemnae]|uniref:Uncharacterized protein n=1 Tax=Stylonychia lemnae TaxID=5949 RepID=A0A078AEW6_STYLE|nr:UNKNOWN [Stylonychia lemnae]|eukprot:CDW79433.1 UNKNOWN [Stylonychia lemnae]